MLLMMHNQSYHQIYSVDGILSVMSPTHSHHQCHGEIQPNQLDVQHAVPTSYYWSTSASATGGGFCGEIYVYYLSESSF